VVHGILRMRGIAGLTGWQWVGLLIWRVEGQCLLPAAAHEPRQMFLIEGMFTVLTGVLFGLFMPHSPDKPVTIMGYEYFNQQEASCLVNRIRLNGPGKTQARKYVQWKDIKNAAGRTPLSLPLPTHYNKDSY
jgi:MFS transporter, ACS family, DAL5 transporter family protein